MNRQPKRLNLALETIMVVVACWFVVVVMSLLVLVVVVGLFACFLPPADEIKKLQSDENGANQRYDRYALYTTSGRWMEPSNGCC